MPYSQKSKRKQVSVTVKGSNIIDGLTVHGDLILNFYNTDDDEVTVEKSTSKVRNTPAVANAKKRVKNRDKCCQVCGEMDKILEVHHIFPVAKYPDLVANEGNMITLCQSCHRKYHDLYEGSEGAESFAKFIRDYGDKI